MKFSYCIQPGCTWISIFLNLRLGHGAFGRRPLNIATPPPRAAWVSCFCCCCTLHSPTSTTPIFSSATPSSSRWRRMGGGGGGGETENPSTSYLLHPLYPPGSLCPGKTHDTTMETTWRWAGACPGPASVTSPASPSSLPPSVRRVKGEGQQDILAPRPDQIGLDRSGYSAGQVNRYRFHL